MTELVKTSLGVWRASGVGEARVGCAGSHQATISLSGTGSVSATVALKGSADGKIWATIGTSTLSGTDSAVGSIRWTDEYAYWIADVQSMTGSVLAVDVLSDQTGTAPAGTEAVFLKAGQLMTPGGVEANKQRRNKRYTQRLMNAPALATFDTTSFRWIEAVPFTGKKFVRVKYENDTTSAWAGTMTTAVAGGRAFADDNPVNASGVNPTWSVSTGLAVPAGDASLATNGKWGAAWTPWMLVDFPPAVDGGYGSYLYIGMKLSTGTGRGLVRNGTQKFEEWETILSAGSTRQKSRRCWKTGADYVTSNQNAMTGATTGAGGAFFSPAVQFEVMDVEKGLVVYNGGDSTRGGQGTTAFNWNWMNQWADSRVSAEVPVSVTNFGFAGKPGAYYMGFIQQMLTDGSPLPDWLILQPFTANTASEAGIQTDLQTAFSLAEQFEAKGVVVTFSTVGPAVNWFGASQANEAVRLYGNAMIRNSSRPYIDLDAVVTDGVSPIAAIKAAYTPDGNHYNDAANAEIARVAVAPIAKRLFGI